MTFERMLRIDEYRRNQPISELKRKADKAYRKKGNAWTLEEIDLAKAEAKIISDLLDWRKKVYWIGGGQWAVSGHGSPPISCIYRLGISISSQNGDPWVLG